VIPPGGYVYTCYGYWTSAYLNTDSCCQGGYSYTGFNGGYFDTRYSDVWNLHIYAHYPTAYQPYLLWNKSGVWVWYSVQVS